MDRIRFFIPPILSIPSDRFAVALAERDPEQPSGVTAEDLLERIVRHIHEAAGANLILEVADAVAAREPARITPVDDPLWPDGLVELANQVFERERVRHPAHPLVRARRVDAHVLARPAQEQQLFDVLNAEVRNDEFDGWEVLRHLLQQARIVAAVPGDAAAGPEHSEVDQDRDTQPLARLPDGVQLALVDRPFESRRQ